MAGTKKPRKAHRPREIRNDIPALLFESDQPLPDHQRASILIAAHASVSALARGSATSDDWHTIVNAMNISQILCEGAGNKEVGLSVIHAAQNAVIEVGERCKQIGRLGVSGDGLRTINEAMALYEQLLETVMKRQYMTAIKEADRRIKAGNVVRLKREGTRKMSVAGLAV